MDSSLILSNILNPPVLFFFIGMMAAFLRSDLEILHPLPKLFSLYLLFAIGFKGGHEIHESGISDEIAVNLSAAIVLAGIVPVYSFFILKTKLVTYNASAIAATYIAVPAAMRMTIAEANPSLYISMALALTFPFNIIIGIPVYLEIINRIWL